MRKLYVLLFSSLFISIQAQVNSGPMVGYSTMKEVPIWLQLKQEGEVVISYWKKGDKSNKQFSDVVTTQKLNHNIAKVILVDLEPGHHYEYGVILDGEDLKFEYPLAFQTQELWQWRTDPPPFTFLTGSCLYVNEPLVDRPGTPYGGNNEILLSMAAEESDFMMWLGDNIYLREVDWDSRTGIYHRNNHTRAVKELQPLLASTHNYAIWDDHDYGPNDSDGTYEGKNMTLEAFKDFWLNPNYVMGPEEGITGKFSWADCEFFLLDNRWNRTPESDDGHILGEEQLTWFIDALRSSNAAFKFVCIGGPFLSNARVYENHANFSKERNRILQALDEYNIKRVVFLNGDRHHSELSKYETEDGQIFYEITASPITSTARDHTEEPNTNRYEEVMIGERNYAKIQVDGPFRKRNLKVSFHNTKGEIIVEKILEF